MSGLFVLRIAASALEDAAVEAVQFPTTSKRTLGRFKKSLISAVGSLSKQSTLCQPRSANCRDSSRAKVSVPPIRSGCTPNTETTVGIEALAAKRRDECDQASFGTDKSQ